ncbi:gallate 1-beta-glucosyltransferase-like [Neltuma alba]|uniref:gallate 1-beta-glucosyltransferase-like n=1 Tax=Neltuma alba TaxID=207710 RepID=UPI0010A34C13|nr:gallate 1-beta-glucosyltransferase-like [Prosopis alba]
MLKAHADRGRPVSCLISNPFIPWVTDMAESLGLPSAMLWVQSCACFSAYYHFYHKLLPFPSEDQMEISVQLPNMPLLKDDEIPSFLYPTTPYRFLRRAIMGQYRNLERPFCVLMDSFEELERENVEYMSKICPIRTVGPLFKNPKVPNSTVKGDILKADDCVLDWINTKPPSSVVYVSFGSVVYLKQEQVDEIAYGLLDAGASFIWVMKPPHKDSGFEPHVLPDGFLEEVGNRGKVVQWSLREQILGHPSVACFVTHCRWNSTMEAITSGVPLVAFPQWGDQATNAKYIVNVFKVGVRMRRGEAANELIPREEVKKCLLEATVDHNAKKMKENVLRLKAAAEATVAEGGSSDRNIQEFVDEVRKRSVEILKKNSKIIEGSVNNVVSPLNGAGADLLGAKSNGKVQVA